MLCTSSLFLLSQIVVWPSIFTAFVSIQKEAARHAPIMYAPSNNSISAMEKETPTLVQNGIPNLRIGSSPITSKQRAPKRALRRLLPSTPGAYSSFQHCKLFMSVHCSLCCQPSTSQLIGAGNVCHTFPGLATR